MRARNCPLWASAPYSYRQRLVTHLWLYLTRIWPPFNLLHSCKVLLEVRGLCLSPQTLVVPLRKQQSVAILHPVLCPEILISNFMGLSLIRAAHCETLRQVSRPLKKMRLRIQICCNLSQPWNWGSIISLTMHCSYSRFRIKRWRSYNLR